MKISYSWLKSYINITLSPEEVAKTLTDCGLEVEGMEKFQSIKGGLEGIVIGEVKTRIQHPNADRLSVTTVDVGNGEPLQIVCGAPNVAAGQKVVVALVGATLYPISGESFQIGKSKIRGEASEGMLCAEDEIGLGSSHAGIMVLENTARIGMKAKEYFKTEDDVVFEIGLTPNRADAASHIGTARDLLAVLSSRGVIQQKSPVIPDISAFKADKSDTAITVTVEDTVACPRYSGITLTGVTVKPSPDWLQNRLKAIGIRPVNNIVDITSFVMLECGQPLHAFDANKIAGRKVLVKKPAENTKFTTLDGVERTLNPHDLMICDANGGLCIAGVFGGVHSGITTHTTDVFIESAYFDPAHVRRTSKQHGLKTDASFRFERGTDPEMTIYAAKRAALLIKELAGGKICGGIIDIYPSPIQPRKVLYNYKSAERLLGMSIEHGIVKEILQSLGIKIVSETAEALTLSVPAFKTDVHAECDIVEEVLRIYGYNSVPVSEKVNSTLSYNPRPDKEKLQNAVSSYLSANGYFEMMNTSQSRSSFTDNITSLPKEEQVFMLNPISTDLDVMRQTMLFSGLGTIAYNKNRKQHDLKLYEFGKTYHKVNGKYCEYTHLSLFITGRKQHEQWNAGKEPVDFYTLKSAVVNILAMLGIDHKRVKLTTETGNEELMSLSMSLIHNGKKLAALGAVKKQILKKSDINSEVYFANLYWDEIIALHKKQTIAYKEVAKFPEVRRDLSMIIDKKVTFADICQTAYQSERQLLTDINIFDVYAGEKIEPGKKSYALSFTLLDEEKTLTDKQIDKVMERIMQQLERNLGAVIRKN